MLTTEKKIYTPEEYLELEEVAEYKSEYINGEIIPMAGASINHNRICRNLIVALDLAFKEENFEAFMGDIRLWIPDKQIYTYPDVMIISSEPEFWNDRNDTITNPVAIIEVLSPSTKSYDRQDKFMAYRSIPSFQEYLLVEQSHIYVEHFSKLAPKHWSMKEYNQEDEAIELVSVPFQISIADLYNKVKITESNNESNIQ